MKCGIVGLPNVGKSTLFNALTATQAAQAANYPFCTIEPNVGCVLVPDPRLDVLAKVAGSKVTLPSQISFVDIAGLVEGASKGEGLGNQFLSHIREVDAILHVVRSFESSDIVHVAGKIHPLDDIEIIETELILADLQSVEKRLDKKSKKVEGMTPLLEKAFSVLKEGQFASCAPWTKEEQTLFPQLALLTLKPIFYLINVSEEDLVNQTIPFHTELEKHAATHQRPILFLSSHLECEVSQLAPADRESFLKMMGIQEIGLNKLIRLVYDHMGLMTFFTVGPNETRAWTIHLGDTAFDAAGCIHTDFQKGFIKAEVMAYQDYVDCGGPVQGKIQGKLRIEGKDYLVQDGDVLLFRFNV